MTNEIGEDGKPIEGAAPVQIGEDGQPIVGVAEAVAPEPEPEVKETFQDPNYLFLMLTLWKTDHICLLIGGYT